MQPEITSQLNTEILDRIARITAATVKAPIVLITVRQAKRLSVVGSHGVRLAELDGAWSIRNIFDRAEGISYVKDVRRHRSLREHPLIKAAPYIRSLAYVPVVSSTALFEAAITIIDPDAKWPFTANTSSILLELSMLVSNVLTCKAILSTSYLATELETVREFSEGASPIVRASPDHTDSAGQFLLGTLVQRTSIRNRNNVSYATLRTWAKPIKEHQIEALKIAKRAPQAPFVASVADEIAGFIRRLYGTPNIDCIVPMPGSHSKSKDCFSVLIARRLSKTIKVPVVNALGFEPRKGSSHPRKNTSLRAPVLTTKKKLGTVLLVDDVASSGRHIELAIEQLRKQADHVTAVAWIGAK